MADARKIHPGSPLDAVSPGDRSPGDDIPSHRGPLPLIMKRYVLLSFCALIAGCSRSASEYVARGHAQSKSGKSAEAVLSFRKAIQKDPKLGEAYLGLGLASYQESDFVGAYQALSTALEYMPGNREAIARLAEVAMGALLVDSRRPEHLKKQLILLSDRMLQHDAKSSEGLRIRGLLAAIDRKHDQALEYFKRANSSGPLNPGLKLLEIQALIDTNRAAEAEGAARSLIQNRPEYGPAYDLLAAFYLGRQRRTEAEEILRRKVEANPNDIEFHLQLARFYSQLGNREAVKSAVEAVLSRKASEDSFVRVGDFYAEMGEFEKALPLYRRGLSKDHKTKLTSLKRIATVLRAQKKYADALNAVRDARKIMLHDEEAIRLEADLLTQTGNPQNVELATRIYRELLIRAPGHSFVRFSLARALAAKGDIKGAREELEQCVRFSPTYLPAINALAAIYRQSGEARDMLILADRVLAEDDTNIGAKLLRAEGLLRTGRPADAQNILIPLLQHPSLGREAGLLLARAHVVEKDFTRAEVEFRKHYVPGHVDLRALQGLSDLLLLQSRASAVVALWQQEASRSPDSLPVKRGLAKAAYLSRHFDLAARLYTEISGADSTDVESHFYLAASLLSGGKQREGYEAFKRASELPNSNKALIDGIIGYLYQFEGNGQLSDLYHRKVLERDPKNTAALNNLAYSLAARRENLEDALHLATRATEMQPDNPEFQDTLAFVQLRNGNKDYAEKQFAALVLRFPQHPGFRYHHALALLELGRIENARSELNFALARTPSPELTKKIRLALTSFEKGS